MYIYIYISPLKGPQIPLKGSPRPGDPGIGGLIAASSALAARDWRAQARANSAEAAVMAMDDTGGANRALFLSSSDWP